MFSNWSSIVPQSRPGEPDFTPIKPPAPFQGNKVFPTYTSVPDPSKPSFTPPADAKSFYSYIQKIKKATDVTPNHLDSLGVSVEYNVPIEKMVPEGNWLPEDDDKVFSERKKELLIANEDAFDVLAKRNKEIRLGHMYRFFQAMELVKPFYPTEPESSRSPSSPSDGEEKFELASGKRKPEENVEGGVEKKGKTTEITQEHDTGVSGEEGKEGEKKSDKKEKPGKFQIPEKFREELVKNFIEPICWGYGVRV
jgi:hypothetical protein